MKAKSINIDEIKAINTPKQYIVLGGKYCFSRIK